MQSQTLCPHLAIYTGVGCNTRINLHLPLCPDVESSCKMASPRRSLRSLFAGSSAAAVSAAAAVGGANGRRGFLKRSNPRLSASATVTDAFLKSPPAKTQRPAGKDKVDNHESQEDGDDVRPLNLFNCLANNEGSSSDSDSGSDSTDEDSKVRGVTKRRMGGYTGLGVPVERHVQEGVLNSGAAESDPEDTPRKAAMREKIERLEKELASATQKNTTAIDPDIDIDSLLGITADEGLYDEPIEFYRWELLRASGKVAKLNLYNVDNPACCAIIGVTETQNEKHIAKLLESYLVKYYPHVFLCAPVGDMGSPTVNKEKVLGYILQEKLSKEDRKRLGTQGEGGLVLFINSHQSHVGKISTKLVQTLPTYFHFDYCNVQAKGKHKPTKEQVEVWKAKMSALRWSTAGRSYRYDAATNDPIGGTGFVIAVATVFDGDAVIRDKETKRAIGLNRKPRMTIEQLGLACAKLELRFDDPTLTRGAGMSHEIAIAAATEKLRRELAVSPSKAIEVVDHGQRWYMTDEVMSYFRNRYIRSVEFVPETEPQAE